MGKRVVTTMIVFLLGAASVAVSADPDPGLVGWWKFDGDALDSSGNNRNGVLTGDATYGPGLIDQALVLDGNGDYVTITGYKGILGGNPFTIAAWVNTTDTTAATMVNWGSSTNGQRVDFRLDQGRLRVEHGNGNLQGNTILSDGEWHHVALTVKASASISYPDCKLYLDGKDDSQMTADADKFNITAVTDVTIGRRGTNTDRAIEALLDDVRIYDRQLTAAEVAELAARPRAFVVDPADGAEGVGMPLFTWLPRQSAVWHAIYIGTSPDLGPDQLVQAQWMGTTYWHAPGLEPGTTYYWRVDEVDPDGTVYPGDVWSFMISPLEAWQPFPVDGEPYTDADLTLSWRLGLNAVTHDVYFGTEEAAVAEGAGDTFKGNQALLTFPTGALAPDTTYYWRVDEVDAMGQKVEGKVWSFRVLPEIPVRDPNMVAWWTFDEGAGVRAVDWSGHSRHAQFPASGARWVQGYDGTAVEFDGSAGEYLEVMGYPGVLGKTDRTNTAWIQTTQVGDILYWGLQTTSQKWRFRVQADNGNPGSLRVECEGGRICGWTDLRDGEWHHVAAVLASAGAPTILDVRLYVDGVQEAISDSQAVDIDTLDGGRNVRIGNGYQSYPFLGLIDDIRIYDKALTQEELDAVMRIDPLRAWRPYPGNGAIVDVRTAMPLTWSVGDGAAKHDVYLGTDANAVGAADASDATGVYRGRQNAAGYTPAEDIAWGQKYYWRIDEIDADGTITKGKVWTFSVADYLIVEDFESYTNESPNRVFQTWIDGMGYSPDEYFPDGHGGNSTNAAVGYDIWSPESPHYNGNIMERANVYSGSQAMPMDYNNILSPYYSETERSWLTAQNWTLNDVNTLVLHFRGEPIDFQQITPDHIIMSAAGWDIWSDSALTRFDEFRFVYKRLTGDGTIIARVDSVVNTNAWAKAGVMIRESLDWGSRHASVFITPGQGVAFQRRLANNDAGVSTAQTGIVAPHWVKLTRTGDLLTAQRSDDGVTWGDVVNATNPTSDTVVLGPTVYIGLALTSHSAGVVTTAEFSNVQTSGGVSGQWQMAEIGVEHPGNSPDSLYVAVQDSANKTAVVTHPDENAVLQSTWQRWTIDLASVKSAGVNLKAVKKLFIGVGDRDNPQPDGSGTIYLDDIRLTKGVPVDPNTAP